MRFQRSLDPPFQSFEKIFFILLKGVQIMSYIDYSDYTTSPMPHQIRESKSSNLNETNKMLKLCQQTPNPCTIQSVFQLPHTQSNSNSIWFHYQVFTPLAIKFVNNRPHRDSIATKAHISSSPPEKKPFIHKIMNKSARMTSQVSLCSILTDFFPLYLWSHENITKRYVYASFFLVKCFCKDFSSSSFHICTLLCLSKVFFRG